MIIRLTFLERFLHRLHLLPTPIMDAFGGVLFGRALAIALRRGVFEALALDHKDVADIAAHTHLNIAGVELLLESFVAVGYVRIDHNHYSLTAETRKWLLKDSPSYIGNLVRYFETLYERWGYLEHSLEHGIPPRRYYEKFTAEDWKVYVHAMRDLARLIVGEVMKRIDLPESSRQLLDLGGSHGLYAIECCRRHPMLKATIIDLPEALRHTEQIVAEERMTDRVRPVAGDFMRMELPSAQDCVFLFNVIHGLTEEENRALINRAFQTLTPGGKLYILDQLREERRGSGLAKFMPLMVGLNLLNEIGGNTYAYAQVQSWCKGAASVKRIRLRTPGISLVEVSR